MPKIDTGRSGRPPTRLGASAAVMSCLVAATPAAAPGPADAAAPKIGAWESSSRTDPRVSFDVRGPTRARTVRRLSFPITCKGEPVGWGATTFVRTRANGRFTASDGDSVIRGRFTAQDRAEVTVRSSGGGGCNGTRRYRVVYRGRRIAVRTGRYLSLVTGGASVGLEADAFGRMVRVEYMEGSVTARCSDGSQRPLLPRSSHRLGSGASASRHTCDATGPARASAPGAPSAGTSSTCCRLPAGCVDVWKNV